MRPAPCLECLKRGEAYARRAVAADGQAPDGHVWLAASLGYETRIVGVVRARLDNDPAQAKEHLDAALKVEPDNAYALAALGGWNVEIGARGRKFPGAANCTTPAWSRDSHCSIVRCAWRPAMSAVRYQIALSLAGLDPETYRSRVENELDAAIHAAPETAYEKFVQGPSRGIAGAVEARRPRSLRRQGPHLPRISLTLERLGLGLLPLRGKAAGGGVR